MDNTDIFYTVRVNGQNTILVKTAMIAEMFKQQLPPDQQQQAEVIAVTATGNQLLLD